MLKKLLILLLIIMLLYLALGTGFHFKWEHELEACRILRAAQGEFVEPKVFDGLFGAAMGIIGWPLSMRANLLHFGCAFSTPCDR